MGLYHLGLLAFLGVISMATVQGQPRILFLGADVIRPGTQYDVTVANLGLQAASVLVAIENNVTKARIVGATQQINSGSQASFSLSVPAELDETPKYVVRIVDGNPPTVRYENSTEVRVEKKSRSIFIVTDKSIYKPGAKVLFRAFAVNSNLRPRNEPLSLELFDPKGNKIKQWLNQAGESGVVSGEHQLSTVTSLGDWKIKATSGTEDQTLTFKVDEYVLPKFEVELSLNPSFIVSSTSTMSMTAKVTAKYTIGTPVDGDLTLTVSADRDWYNIKSFVVSRKMSGVQNVDISFPADTFKTCGICAMNVKASVVDSLSGEIRTATTKFQTWRKAEKLVILDGPKFIKPGLKSRFVVKITQQDGTPVVDTALQIKVKVTQNTKPQNIVNDYSYPLPANGLLEVEYDVLPETTTLGFEANYNGVTTTTYLSEVFKSFSNHSIEVERDLDPTIPLDQIKFIVRSTEDISYVYYQILSKKGVQASGRQIQQPPAKSLVIPVQSSPAFAPSATMLVYYVNSNNELIASSQRFTVPLTFKYQMSMTWDQEQRKVNEMARLTVFAKSQSYVAVGAVDQSVLLLGESNDITGERIAEELESYDQKDDSCCGRPVPFEGGRGKRSIWFPFFSASDTAKVIESAGLVYMTDANVFRTQQFNDDFLERADGDVVFKSVNGGTATLTTDPTEVYVRKSFPESWIWESGKTGANGKAEFIVNVPDTLTTWVATSFALHPTDGLAIPPQRANLTAFLPFFMRVDKPYAVVRGEVITLKVLVFNYMGSTKDVTVTLQSSQEFTVKDSLNSVVGESKDVTRSVQVLDQKGATVSFIIVPQTIGVITLSLRANTAGAADGLEDTLLVEPEGRLVQMNDPIFVNLQSGQSAFSSSNTVSFPQNNVVEGSRMIKVKVIGDLLGTTLDGLLNLVRMPYGCGEQNMITFTPNIFVRKYLERTNTLSSKTRADTTKYMESGYERELTYQRKEGSFSAFGDSDKFGSTWLTAFVIDSFKQAQPYIYIDDSVLVRALGWLIQNTYNTREGTFREVGNVIHEEMQGGSGSTNTMTAYVLVALERCRDLNQSLPSLLDAINGARQNLENSVATTSELYNLAIMGYALQLSGSSLVPSILEKLEAQQEGTGTGVTYWKVTNQLETESCLGRRSCGRPNNQVELASFVLLTYVARNDLTKALPIARFLMSQKNPQGGFYSTQDTVWGLNALAEFSATSRSDGQQYTVGVSVGQNAKKEFFVNQVNSQVLQSVEIFDDQINGNAVQVNVDVAGNGAGLVEIMSRYHTTEEESSPKLKLEVNTVNKNVNTREVTSCVRVLDASLRDMIVVELNDPSGFPIDKNSIPPNSDIKRVEKDGKKTSIYFGEMSPGSNYCVTAMAYKQNDVENVKAPMARAFAYYSGDETSTVMSKTNAPSDSAHVNVCSILMSALLTFVALLNA